MEKQNWIISCCNSDDNTIYIDRIYATEEDVKKYIHSQIIDRIQDDKDNYDWGTDKLKDLITESNGKQKWIDGIVEFSDYHVIFTAMPEEEIDTLDLKKELQFYDYDTSEEDKDIDL